VILLYGSVALVAAGVVVLICSLLSVRLCQGMHPDCPRYKLNKSPDGPNHKGRGKP
jgi:hypothetical protein